MLPKDNIDLVVEAELYKQASRLITKSRLEELTPSKLYPYLTGAGSGPVFYTPLEGPRDIINNPKILLLTSSELSI